MRSDLASASLRHKPSVCCILYQRPLVCRLTIGNIIRCSYCSSGSDTPWTDYALIYTGSCTPDLSFLLHAYLFFARAHNSQNWTFSEIVCRLWCLVFNSILLSLELSQDTKPYLSSQCTTCTEMLLIRIGLQPAKRIRNSLVQSIISTLITRLLWQLCSNNANSTRNLQ